MRGIMMVRNVLLAFFLIGLVSNASYAVSEATQPFVVNLKLSDDYEEASFLMINHASSETIVTKIDASALNYSLGNSNERIRVKEIEWFVSTGNNENVVIEYLGTLSKAIALMAGRGSFSLSQFNNATGANGDVILTTNNFNSTSSYMVKVTVEKVSGYQIRPPGR